MSIGDSPLVMPAKRFSADQKQHRADNAAVEQFSQTQSLSLIPIGGVVAYAGAVAPPGYLECDGSAVSRTTYAALFSVISDVWGVGDGSTTFNVPTLAQMQALYTATHSHGGITAGAGTSSSTDPSEAGGMFIIRSGAN